MSELDDDSQILPESDLAKAFAQGLGHDAATDSDPGLSLIDRIAKSIGARPEVTLRDVDEGKDAPILQPLDPDAIREAGKYVIHGEIGTGGVGSVHRGHDQDLGRDVAMKFLHERYKDTPEIVQRFVEEAQIGGQLQHPGIVPVYDLGITGGKPFFSMKLVKGHTLAEELAERPTPSADRRHFLSIFEQVCQTLSYAHARGVVHRDLKPANIMIGAFGEVQVVDWGMGKVLARGGVADERRSVERHLDADVIETLRSKDDGTHSLVGSVMGTPAYMPPEQARGQVDQMNERSDVFSLGAILCEILTGKPPYIGQRDEVIRSAERADLAQAHARLDRCAADAEIVALAKRCLVPNPSERPRSGAAVAEAVQHYLSTLEQRAQDAIVRTEALKRTQKLGITLTAVIAIGLAISLWFWRDSEQQRVLADLSAQEARQAEQAADEARLEEAEARSAAEALLANYNRLSNVVLLESAIANEQLLYPAGPRTAAALRSWRENEAQELLDALPDLRATLASLESLPADNRGTAAKDADTFLRSTLEQLIGDIESFRNHQVASVEARLVWAELVEDLTVTRFADRWKAARIAILRADGTTASRLYASSNLELPPQVGLVPLGMNPETKLWEFYHLRSARSAAGGEDPARLQIPFYDADGTSRVESAGLTFVLVPGERFLMGAQAADRNAPRFDSRANGDESPVTEVDLDPYFLSKYEMTQGQWARLTAGEFPSYYRVGESIRGPVDFITENHPVEQVSWGACGELLQRFGLELPTEAQWEYACRAKRATPWSSGAEATSLHGHANVHDDSAASVQVGTISVVGFDDGYPLISPVGAFAASPFGFHDMHGNVAEWCRESYCNYELPPEPGDGYRRLEPPTPAHVLRGGSFTDGDDLARSTNRNPTTSDFISSDVGVRPVRRIQP